MPQYRERARMDPNRVPCPPRTPETPQVYPPKIPVIEDTHEALFDLVDTLLQYETDVQGNVGQWVGTSKADLSIDHTGDADRSERRVTPHPCTSCGGICYGLTSDFRDNGLLRFVRKTHYFHMIFCFISQFSIVYQFITI